MLTPCCCILLGLSAGLEGPYRSSEHWSGGTLPPFKGALVRPRRVRVSFNSPSLHLASSSSGGRGQVNSRLRDGKSCDSAGGGDLCEDFPWEP